MQSGSRPSKHYKQKIEELEGECMLEQLPERKSGGKLDKIQSARQTRMRKKIYIGLLEQRLKNKDGEIAELKAEVAKLRQERPRNADNLRNRGDLFRQIEESVRRQEQQKTQDLLDVLRVRPHSLSCATGSAARNARPCSSRPCASSWST